MAIPSSNRYPGAYFEVFFGAGRQAPGTAVRRTVLVGYGLSGTGVTDVLYGPHASADDVATVHGAGRPLHLAAIAFFKEYPDGTLHTLAYTESGTATTKTLTITNNATATGTLTLDFNALYLQVTITSGQTPGQQATAIAAAVNAKTSLPVTATAALGVVTVTTKWTGPSSQQLQFRYLNEGITGSTYAIAAGVSGATDADPTTALDAISSEDFDYMVVQVDTTSTSLGQPYFLSYVNTRARPENGLRGVMIGAFSGTYANAVTLATALNGHRAQLVWDRDGNYFTFEAAAAMGGMRARAEQIDISANLMLRTFNTWRAPYAASSKISLTEAKNALNNGITPIRYNRAGQAFAVLSITTRFQDANGAADYRTLDTNKVAVVDDIADTLAIDWPVRFPDWKLTDDADGPLADKVANKRIVKSWIFNWLKDYESSGHVKNVDDNEGSLVVNIGGTVPQGRASCKIPVDVIDWFKQLDANLYQIG